MINPSHLRAQLISYLQKKNVMFHWRTPILASTIQSEPSTHWIMAAGNGALSLLKNTKFEKVDFTQESIGKVIYCTLRAPLDLKGKMFHMGASQTTPAFHLRNDDQNITKLKIVIEHTVNDGSNLDETTRTLFSLLKLEVAQYYYIDTISRTVTPDGRPIIEHSLGMYGNIHFIYGHNLYSLAAQIYPLFASNLAFLINQKERKTILRTNGYSQELEQFSFSHRFINSQQPQQPPYAPQLLNNLPPLVAKL